MDGELRRALSTPLRQLPRCDSLCRSSRCRNSNARSHSVCALQLLLESGDSGDLSRELAKNAPPPIWAEPGMEELRCANCGRQPHAPVYLICVQYVDYRLEVLICGHCWTHTFIAPMMDARLQRLAFRTAERRLPGF